MFNFEPYVIEIQGYEENGKLYGIDTQYYRTKIYNILQPTEFTYGYGFGYFWVGSPYGKIVSKTIYWYNERGADDQFNASGKRYYFSAIG